MMRILQIAPPWLDTPPRDYGGTEQVIYNLVEGLTQLGQQVTLFATKKSKSPRPHKYVYSQGLLDQKIPWSAALPPLIHYFEAFKIASDFDIVHAHLSSQTDIMILPFLADLSDKGIPMVMTIHGHTPYDQYSHFDKTYFRLYAHKIPVINISHAMERFTPKEFKKIGVVHNSVDGNRLTFRQNKGNYLTWLGQIIPNKNTHVALEVAKKAKIPMIFGGFVDKHNPLSVPYFETKVKPLIDNKLIKFIGPTNNKQKNDLFGNALAFLNPINWEEPFGMVMVESLATGTPVIAFNKGAVPELVQNGKTGFIVRDQQEMLKAISNVDSISRHYCRQSAEQQFSPAEAARKHIDIYTKLIESAPLSKVTTKRKIIYKSLNTLPRG